MPIEVTQNMLAGFNAFVEDTCVIFSAAYLLSRGRTFDSILSPSKPSLVIQTGITIGLVGGSEMIFPGMRYPYLTDTLAIAFIAYYGRGLASAIAMGTILILSLVLRQPGLTVESFALMLIIFLTSAGAATLLKRKHSSLWAGVVGGVCQVVGLLAINEGYDRIVPGAPIHIAWATVPANAFGLFLVSIVIQDAENRLSGQRHRLDLEKLKTLQVTAELAALRSRIHPHFLFNSLSAIAALCNIDVMEAERTILNLARLMRRTIASSPSAVTSLEEELNYVRAYVDIQLLRFGDRVKVSIACDESLSRTDVPAFGLQTLVENSFQHGFERGSNSGVITVTGRKTGVGAFFAVEDTGLGASEIYRSSSLESGELPRHGMGIIDKELRLLYGSSARLRVFTSPGHGTLVCFRIPDSDRGKGKAGR